MQGTIAQMVALTLYGNHFFQTRKAVDFFSNNSTCTFCQSVVFMERVSTERLFARTPSAWYEKLCTEGFHGLRLHYTLDKGPDLDRNLVAFVGGGGRWLIEAVHDSSSSDYWATRWQVGERKPDNRIWVVTYDRVASRVSSSQKDVSDLSTTIEALGSVLQALVHFSEKQTLTNFARCFSIAIDLLSDPAPLTKVFHSDLSPSGYLSREAQALLAAAQAAWVFGGMGSWNDLGFDGDDQKTYDFLSTQLYTLLNTAIIQATNTSYQ